MRRFFQSFLAVLAASTDRQLAQELQYLREENRVLRSRLPRRIVVTPKERQRLVRFGKPLGTAIRHLLSIVSLRTFARWLSAAARGPGTTLRPDKPGRPKTPDDVRELVLRLARETGWGYTRILGELKMLGVSNVSRTTVINLLWSEGMEPGPKRGEGTWADFLKRHATTLWACDFFSKKVWTARGLVEVFVLFFIQVGSRRVHIAGLTTHPDRAWMTQQARNFTLYFDGLPERPTHLLRDYDSKFVPEFDAVLASEGIHVRKVGPRAPNLNATAERFVQSVKGECLDHFVFFGEAHLRHVLSAYERHYNQERPHQGIGNVPVSGAPPIGPAFGLGRGEVICEERLGGLLKHYRRAA